MSIINNFDNNIAPYNSPLSVLPPAYNSPIELCEDIGNTFGDFYVDVSGILTINTYNDIYTYDSVEDLLIDWLPKLIEDDEAQNDNYWAEAIDYIRSLDIYI